MADDWHPATDLSGVGAATAAAMAARGYAYAEDLLRCGRLAVAADLEPVDGLTLGNVVTALVPQARLLRLPGLPPAVAAAWARAGLGYGQLVWTEPSRLARLAEAAGAVVDAAAVAEWQLDAARRHRTGTVTVRLDPAVDGAEVAVADPHRTGVGVAWRRPVRHGRALVEYLAPGRHELTVTAPGHAGRSIGVVADEGGYQAVSVRVVAGATAEIDEAADGPREDGAPQVTVAVDLDDFADGTLAEVTALGDVEARLTAVFRRRAGAAWRVRSATAPRDLLPAGAGLGAVVRVAAGGLELLAGQTRESVRAAAQPAAVRVLLEARDA